MAGISQSAQQAAVGRCVTVTPRRGDGQADENESQRPGPILRWREEKASGRKVCFFEKKKQKTFFCFGFGLSGDAQPRLAKVFWFFFSKKNCFLCLELTPPPAALALRRFGRADQHGLNGRRCRHCRGRFRLLLSDRCERRWLGATALVRIHGIENIQMA